MAEGWQIGADDSAYEVARVHGVTPESPDTTHLFYQVARNFRLDSALVGGYLHDVMKNVLRTDVDVMEAVELSAAEPGASAGIRLNADAGVLRVHRIIESMLASESGQSARWMAARRNSA
jgi:vanillate O-demethylase monooxygenase subunit